MTLVETRTICWTPCWNMSHKNEGLEHLSLSATTAESVVLAFDTARGPFRLGYQLRWNARWQLICADLTVNVGAAIRSLSLRTDGKGRWEDDLGRPMPELDGCLDIDIWPTPFTNSFPLRRSRMRIGERREFCTAWVDGLGMTVQPQRQAYTRLAERHYLFESLDECGFGAELRLDENGIVLDYPGLFRRVSA